MADGPKEQPPLTPPQIPDANVIHFPLEGSQQYSRLPKDFDPTSKDQLERLTDDQLIVALQDPAELFPEAADENNDLAWVGLHPHTFPDAHPQKVAVYQAVFGEWMRRTVKVWGMTPEDLFRGQGDANGK